MSYKVGDVIGRYTVTRDFDSANGGQCQWGFATDGKEELFIKKFLTPVYPGAKAPGSEKGKQKKRNKCQEFEKKQKAIKEALSACGSGGLVVRTVDFFKHGDDYGQHYFKVSQKVDTSSLSDLVHTLDLKKKLFVMVTAAGAVSILHKYGIVHLDLKPDNILIQEYGSHTIAKVIDFDSSILVGESAEAETLVGDAVYYSPEFSKYISTYGESSLPNQKSDIFSLGLIFCRYWTGQLPNYSSSHNYAHDAVIKGEPLSIPILRSEKKYERKENTSRLSGTLMGRADRGKLEDETSRDPTDIAVQQLLQRMLVLSPGDRPHITEVHKQLKQLLHRGAPRHEVEKKPITTTDTYKTKLTFGKNLR